MAVDVRNLPKLKSHNHRCEPLWASDAGRTSNSGKYSGTFVGYFSKITLEFGKTTQSEMTIIKTALQQPIIENLTYKDSDTGNWNTEDFYGTTIEAKLNNWNQMYDSFSIDVIGIEARL